MSSYTYLVYVAFTLQSDSQNTVPVQVRNAAVVEAPCDDLHPFWLRDYILEQANSQEGAHYDMCIIDFYHILDSEEEENYLRYMGGGDGGE